jgi:S1-C subfamily serine protease
MAALVLAALPGTVQGGENPLEVLGRAFEEAAARAAPAVVQILCERDADIDGPPKPGFRIVRGNIPVPPELLRRFQEGRLRFVRPEGPASGVVIDPDGYILTSLYNVLGKIKNLRVVTPDGRTHPAKVLGRDPNRDIALLKIEARNLPSLALSPDLKPKPGQFSLTLGRGPNPAELNVNSGIISAIHRSRGDVIQTSARVNYGNCGGALVDLSGKLVGIITKIGHDYSRNRSGINTGVGFAAPVGVITNVIGELRAGKNIAPRPTPFLGIRFDPSYAPSADVKGVRIEYVYKGFPGERAGLKLGDILVNFEYVDIEHRGTLSWVIQESDPGQEVTFSVLRGEKVLDLKAVLTERPNPLRSARMSREYLEWKMARALGIRADLLYPQPGAFVRYIHEGFPLAEGGMRAGDIILGVHGLKDFPGWFPIFFFEYLDRTLPYCFETAKVTFMVWREGKRHMIPIIVGPPADEAKIQSMDREFKAAAETLPSVPDPATREQIAKDIARWKMWIHLGLWLEDLSEEGWRVGFALPGFPGAKAGIREGDLFVTLRGGRIRRGRRVYVLRGKAILAADLPERLRFLAGNIPDRSGHWRPGDQWHLEYLQDGEKKQVKIVLGEYPTPAAMLAIEGERLGDFRATFPYKKRLVTLLNNRTAAGRYQVLQALNTPGNWDISVAKTLIGLLVDADREFLKRVFSVLKAHPSKETFMLLIESLPVRREDIARNKWEDQKKLEVIQAYLKGAELPEELPDFGLNGKLWLRWWRENKNRVRFPG